MNPGDYVATSAALAVVVNHQPHRHLLQLAEPALRFIASNDAATTSVAGMVAGCLSRTVTAPLDRIKTLAQEGRVGAGVLHMNEFARMRFIGRHVLTREGPVSFWRGNGVNCLKAGPEYAIALTARQHVANVLCRDPKAPSGFENFALGAAGGLTAQLILYPLEVTKTRMAVANATEYNGIADCITQSVQRGGVRDLYRGLSANLVGVVPHRSIEMGIFFSGEQSLRRWYGDATPPLALVSGIGFMASVVSQIATYPLNLARTRLQTQGVNGRPTRYRGLAHCLATVAKTEGVHGLFAGLAPNMLKAAPASTIMYTSFTYIKTNLKQRDQDRVRA